MCRYLLSAYFCVRHRLRNRACKGRYCTYLSYLRLPRGRAKTCKSSLVRRLKLRLSLLVLRVHRRYVSLRVIQFLRQKVSRV